MIKFPEQDYNPFNKKISNIQKSDLEKLIQNEVAEGWYVEYKETFPLNERIGHSIASFANTEGGWFIVGIQANKNNSAEIIKGFDLKVFRAPKEKVGNIIKTHISPIPFFSSKLIKLPNNRAVLVVHIKKGMDAHVTKDGRIYIRIGESSDPIPEKDYYSIQKIFERKKMKIEQIEKFSNNPFYFSETAKIQSPYLEAYYYTLPHNNFLFKDFYSEKFFYKLCENFRSPLQFILSPMTADLKFNNFYASLCSYILRYIPEGNIPIDVIDNTSTIELFENGNAKILYSIPQLNIDLSSNISFDFLPETYKRSERFIKFLNILQKYKFRDNSVNIIDGYSFFLYHIVLVNKYLKFLNFNKFKGNMGVRIRISNIQGRLLYFDDDNYLSFLKKYKIPTLIKTEIEVPKFHNGNLILINSNQNLIAPNIKLENSLHILIFESLGLPSAVAGKFFSKIGEYISKIAKTTPA